MMHINFTAYLYIAKILFYKISLFKEPNFYKMAFYKQRRLFVKSWIYHKQYIVLTQIII